MGCFILWQEDVYYRMGNSSPPPESTTDDSIWRTAVISPFVLADDSETHFLSHVQTEASNPASPSHAACDLISDVHHLRHTDVVAPCLKLPELEPKCAE